MADEFNFNVGDPLPGNEVYTFLDGAGSAKGQAEPLNRGNAGIVFLVLFKNQLKRVVKILLPLPPEEGGDKQAEVVYEILKREFNKEILVLSTITHTGLSKIVDFGELSVNGESYPYYIMDYVQGQRFDEFVRTCKSREFLRILDEILDALAHLHAIGYFHMDVKEENVIIQSPAGSSKHAVLIDLGGAKQIRPAAGRGQSGDTIYISSEKATREERRTLLGGSIRREQLDLWDVDLDLFAFGAMLKRALDPTDRSELRACLRHDLGESGLDAVDWLADQLTGGRSEEPIEQRPFHSAEEVRAALNRLSPEYVAPLGLPELHTVAGAKSLPLPGGRIGVTPEFLRIIDHRLFQRLGRIPQLEYIDLNYRGATHTRFEHSLATFEIAKLFLNRMLEYPEFRMIATPHHVRAALLVALLHDIGHYPLSHMLEDFAYQSAGQRVMSADPVLSDNNLFRNLINPEPNDGIYNMTLEALKGTASDPQDVQPLDVLLRDVFPESYRIMTDLMDDSTQRSSRAPMPLLRGMIDSAIDVDKIAYLSADSRETGVRFGSGIDIPGLVQALVPPRGPDQMRGAIAIKESGLAAAESIVLARFWMISRVYWEETNRSIMAMHKFVIADLAGNNRFSFSKYFEYTLLVTQLSATEYLSDQYESAHPDRGSGAPLARNPLKGLLNANREIYQPLVTISNGPRVEDRELYKGLLDEGAFGVLSLGELIRNFLNRQWAWLGLRYGDVLVDIPRKRRDLLGANVLVYLDREPDKGRDLYEGENPVSAVLSGLPADFEHNVKKCRVFVHPAVMKQIRATNKAGEIADEIVLKLREKFKPIM